MLRQTTHADLISTGTAAVVTLSVQAALAFQKYRFGNGLVLGITLAAVTLYEDITRRKGLPQSRAMLILIATGAAVLPAVLQQIARILATGVPHTITHL
jgi:hypothetical protein